jgi:hypothetical protein
MKVLFLDSYPSPYMYMFNFLQNGNTSSYVANGVDPIEPEVGKWKDCSFTTIAFCRKRKLTNAQHPVSEPLH